jgi:hypothetical protein
VFALNAVLGTVFVLLGFGTAFLMYHLWGYPFDKVARKSEAPRSLMILHRVMGYSFVAIYIVMMIRMVPRMWEYEVEIPPRTVAHIALGMSIGFILLLKISIMRFFRHLEEWMPYLGTLLLLCTVLLIGLSLPFTFREHMMQARVAGGGIYSSENLERVRRVLAEAGLPPEAEEHKLATVHGLDVGRTLMLDKCLRCHDLKTILARPRTPSDWLSTISRMAERPALFKPISQEDQWHIGAYLIAITPEITQSLKRKRELSKPKPESPPTVAMVDLAAARNTFERVCSECHKASDVDKSPPATMDEINRLVGRMVDNGLDADEQKLAEVRAYLANRYLRTM